MKVKVLRTVRKTVFKDKIIEKVVKEVFKKEKVDGELSVHLVGDKKIRKLNKETRGKNKITDVLSFSMLEGFKMPNSEDFGDIFICVPQIERQAKKYGVSFREEFLRMLIHGALHISGLDHKIKKQADEMFVLQERYLKKML